MNALSPGLPISSGACLDDLEQSDDFAHTSGRYRKMQDAMRYRQPDPAAMIADCRMRMETCRHTAAIMARVIRWFRHAPHDALCASVYGEISLPTALSEFRQARRLNRRIAGQLGEWMRRAEAARTSFHLMAAE